MRVLITNFEPATAQKLRWAFVSAGFTVAGGENLVHRVIEEGKDLADCIVMAGERDSIVELASILNFEIPILAIFDKPNTRKRVEILEAGADDCLNSPVAIDELIARVRVLARRSDRSSQVPDFSRVFGNFEYCEKSRIVRRGHRTILLTAKESKLLNCLLESLGSTVSRSKMAIRLWGSDGLVEVKRLQVHVSNLRKKLDSDNSISLIRTAHGHGYFIAVEPK
jgi:DNA-binding response OmpR family regulator